MSKFGLLCHGYVSPGDGEPLAAAATVAPVATPFAPTITSATLEAGTGKAGGSRLSLALIGRHGAGLVEELGHLLLCREQNTVCLIRQTIP